MTLKNKKKVKDIKVGDMVDLESCPYLKNKPIAKFQYVEVLEIEKESANCIVLYYDGFNSAGYEPNQELDVLLKGEKS